MLTIKDGCTACGACAQVCPKNCIVLSSTQQGFVIPQIDETKCVDCNLCEKVCHLNRENIALNGYPRAYAVAHRSKDVLQRSTSGGAFTAIAQYVLSQDGAVFGCAYTEKLVPRHICVENEQELVRLNGSKYVESEIGNTYQQAQAMLDTGRLVLFSGTPCQIAGLKAFLQAEYDNLITADIVCHGVAPRAFFQKYTDWYEKKNGLSLTNYDFRAKQNSGWGLSGVAEGTSLKSGKKVVKKIFYYNEYYYYHFLKGTIYRQSCYACKYANLNRPGDFTLGDLWGAEGLGLDYPIDSGCSLVLCNTPKAGSILDAIEVNKTEIDLDFAVKHNGQLNHASAKPANTEQVLNRFVACSAEELNSWFRRSVRKTRMIGLIKYLIPQRIKSTILKQRYKA